MNRVWRSHAVRTIAAAAFALATVLLCGATPSAAAGLTVNFTGTVAEVDGVFVAAGVALGDAVSGSLTYDPLSSTTSVDIPWPDSTTVFPQAAGSFTFHVSHPGVIDYTQTQAGSGQVESQGSALGDRLSMVVDNGVAGLNLFYNTDGTNPALTTLAGLPMNSSAILALLSGGNPRASGTYRLQDFGNIGFRIDFATATTPVPAALPLFVSALGGLGFFGWRRRRGAGAFSL